MEYRMHSNDGCLHVAVKGDIDHHAADPLRKAVEDAIVRIRPKALILDFSGVEFMDSSGFGFIRGRYKSMARMGGSVTVTGCRERIGKLLILSGAGKYVTIQGVKK